MLCMAQTRGGSSIVHHNALTIQGTLGLIQRAYRLAEENSQHWTEDERIGFEHSKDAVRFRWPEETENLDF